VVRGFGAVRSSRAGAGPSCVAAAVTAVWPLAKRAAGGAAAPRATVRSVSVTWRPSAAAIAARPRSPADG
jgi:hypothetical protein